MAGGNKKRPLSQEHVDSSDDNDDDGDYSDSKADLKVKIDDNDDESEQSAVESEEQEEEEKKPKKKTTKGKEVNKKEADKPRKKAKKAVKDEDDDKEEEEEKEEGGLEKNEEGDEYLKLSANRRVTVRSFKGALLVDIRETYEKDGKTLPGKKGIALNHEQWKALKSSIGALDAAVSKLT